MLKFLVLMITADVDRTQAPKSIDVWQALKVPTTAGATICKTTQSSFGTLETVLLSGGLLKRFLLSQTAV